MLIGHKHQFEYLKKVHERGTFAHAYLFYGPEGVGKLTVAKEWIKLFFDEADHGRVEVLNHPDTIFLSLDHPLVPGEEDSKEIGIENIRELKRLAAMTPHSSSHKFIVIDLADKMSEESQNALLKILEEPNKNTVFILITDSHGSLLPTILSRVVPIRFAFVENGDFSDYFEKAGIGLEAVEKILKLSAGMPRKAVRMVKDKKFLEEEEKKYAQFEKVLKSEIEDQFFWSQKNYQDEETLPDFVYFLLRRVESNLRSGENEKNAIGRYKNIFSYIGLLKRTGINKRLVLDNIFLNLE